MRSSTLLRALAILIPIAAPAQQPAPAPRDSAWKADSAARADSLAIVRELQGRGDTVALPIPPAAQTAVGPTNPRLLPDISVIGELIGDFTPGSITQESGRRIDIREVELALGANVDPYFRADVILGLSDLEGIAIEESYLTAVALPAGLQARLGRFHMPLGKQNSTHRAELQTIEYPYVIQRFLGPEGGKGTGLWLSKILAPFGFYQELLLTAVDHLGESEEDLVTSDPANRRLSGLGYSARFRNYVDLSEATNIEVSASGATGRRAQPITCDGETICAGFDGTPGTNARQGLVGADFTFRWRPLRQGLYKSFILQAEWMREINERNPDLPSVPGATVAYAGPMRNYSGAYVFARYQLARRRFLGARLDWIQDPEYDGRTFKAVSGYVQFFPTEFSKFVVAYERTLPPDGAERRNRILFQSTFAIGPHRPHPF
jgi:hypothetical protein